MDNKFRNHPSLMLEQLGVFGVIIITFLISSLDDLDEILGDIKNSDSTTLLIIILVILAVILFRLAVNTIVWYKTWITVDETSITITKNTIFRSVNTIGLRNISNINIERNLLERILGTSTVKIDTESRSTAVPATSFASFSSPNPIKCGIKVLIPTPVPTASASINSCNG